MTDQTFELYSSPKVFVLIPAHNECENITAVVKEILALQSDDVPVVNKVIVCSNASTDKTAELACKAGASVVDEPQKGYGAACLRAIRELSEFQVQAQDIVVFADGDQSVKVSELTPLLECVRQKGGLVVGARARKLIEHGAMPVHQRAGNLVASFMIRLIWRVRITDLGPFRAISYHDLVTLNMQDRSFGWTTEMQVKTIQTDLPYSEVSVTTRRRGGRSKISGTLSGTLGAAYGIFSTIFWLWLQARGAGLSDELYR